MVYFGDWLTPQVRKELGLSKDAVAAEDSPTIGSGNQTTDPDFEGIVSTSISTGKSITTPTQYTAGVGNIGTAPITSPLSLSSSSSFSPSASSVALRGGATSSENMSNISYLEPTGEAPSLGEYPTYVQPEFDKKRISELTELAAGAPMGRLKQGLDRGLIEARYSDNPNIRNLARKAVLSGYGSGLTDVRSGAHKEAMSEYMPEYQASLTAADTEYQTGVNRVNTQYEADLNNYMRTMRSVSRTVPTNELDGKTDSLGVRNLFTFSPFNRA